jgi:hypothetical protein
VCAAHVHMCRITRLAFGEWTSAVRIMIRCAHASTPLSMTDKKVGSLTK